MEVCDGEDHCEPERNTGRVFDDVKFLGRLTEFYRRMREAGFTYDDLQLPIDNPQSRESLTRHIKHWRAGGVIADIAPAAIPTQPVMTEAKPEIEHLISGMFTPPAKQHELVRTWNTERKWGFSEEDFAALGEPPVWPKGKFSAVVLEVSLDTTEQTFEEAWHFAKSVQPGDWRWEEVKSDPKHLRLLSGIQHQRGLRWCVVDFAANWEKRNGIRPQDVRNPAKSPHSAILWAVSYFPTWVQAMDGVNVPFVWIPGYELSVSGSQPWTGVPRLFWFRGSRRVRLSADRCDERDGLWTVPEFWES